MMNLAATCLIRSVPNQINELYKQGSQEVIQSGEGPVLTFQPFFHVPKITFQAVTDVFLITGVQVSPLPLENDLIFLRH